VQSRKRTIADRHRLAAHHNKLSTAKELSGGINIDDLERYMGFK